MVIQFNNNVQPLEFFIVMQIKLSSAHNMTDCLYRQTL